MADIIDFSKHKKRPDKPARPTKPASDDSRMADAFEERARTASSAPTPIGHSAPPQPAKSAAAAQGVRLPSKAAFSEAAPIVPKEQTGPTSGPDYEPGTRLRCEILSAELSGYNVLIIEDNIRAFLPTEHEYAIGSEIEAEFVCFHNLRYFVTHNNHS